MIGNSNEGKGEKRKQPADSHDGSKAKKKKVNAHHEIDSNWAKISVRIKFANAISLLLINYLKQLIKNNGKSKSKKVAKKPKYISYRNQHSNADAPAQKIKPKLNAFDASNFGDMSAFYEAIKPSSHDSTITSALVLHGAYDSKYPLIPRPIIFDLNRGKILWVCIINGHGNPVYNTTCLLSGMLPLQAKHLKFISSFDASKLPTGVAGKLWSVLGHTNLRAQKQI